MWKRATTRAAQESGRKAKGIDSGEEREEERKEERKEGRTHTAAGQPLVPFPRPDRLLPF